MGNMEYVERKDVILVLKNLSQVREFADTHKIMMWLTRHAVLFPEVPNLGYMKVLQPSSEEGCSTSLHPIPTPWHHHPAGFPVV